MRGKWPHRVSGHSDAMVDGLAAQIASYRATREHIERDTLPLATSVDGVTFEFQASLHGLTLERGCYVMLAGDDGRRLGQITDIGIDTDRLELGRQGPGATSMVLRVARGSGLVLDLGEIAHIPDA